MNYWMFQCNEQAYTIFPDTLTEWSVPQLSDQIRNGDKAIICISGNTAGVYALADISSDPAPLGIRPDHDQWNENNEVGHRKKRNDANVLKVKIAICAKPKERIPKRLIRQTPGLEAFRGGRPGTYATNFPSTQAEYEIILGIINNV